MKYDTIGDITESLGSLESFNKLIDERRVAGYTRKERLTRYLVLGMFYLDSNGNCGVAIKQIRDDVLPFEAFPGIQPVLTMDTFSDLCNQYPEHRCSDTFSFCSMPVAPTEAVCEFCRLGWTITDCWNIEAHRGEDDVWRYYHTECHATQLAAKTKMWFSFRLLNSGWRGFHLQEIPNQYGSLSYRGPWYKMYCGNAVITVGWRKRVVEINWEATKKPLLRLFLDVNNTKGEYLIHAYSAEQTEDYLGRLKGELR